LQLITAGFEILFSACNASFNTQLAEEWMRVEVPHLKPYPELIVSQTGFRQKSNFHPFAPLSYQQDLIVQH